MEGIPRIPIISLSSVTFGEKTEEKEEDNEIVDTLMKIKPQTPNHDEVIKTIYKHIDDIIDERDRWRILLGYGRRMGNESYTKGLYKDAISYYTGVLKLMPRGTEGVLSSKFFNPAYMYLLLEARQREAMLLMDLMACCNNVAQCYIKLDDIVTVRCLYIQNFKPDTFSGSRVVAPDRNSVRMFSSFVLQNNW